MGHSYSELVELVGQAKADALWAKAGKALPSKKDPRPEYTKLSETGHAKLFHKWLDSKYLKHTHIGNESGQAGTRNIVVMMAKKKAVGVSKGFPDYVIYVPIEGLFVQVCVELKKARGVQGGLNGSHISKTQTDWANVIRRSPCSFFKFCHGSDEAIEYVSSMLAKFSAMDSLDLYDYWMDSMESDIASFPEPTTD